MKWSAATRRRHLVSLFWVGGTVLATAIALLPLLSILAYVGIQGIPVINWEFLTQIPAPAGEGIGGIANALVGTLIVVGIAAVLGVPVGIMAGIYLSEYGRTGGWPAVVRFVTDVMTGIPSIVIGIVAYELVVRPMGNFSAYAGGVALAFLLLPVVTRTTEEMLKLVPHHLREAALALGIPYWRTVLFVVVPTAARGIVTGAMLGVARIAGETAPLLFTALGNQFWHEGLNQPIAALSLQIFNDAISAYDDLRQRAWATAFILILLVLMLNVASRALARGSRNPS